RNYHAKSKEQEELAHRVFQLEGAIEAVKEADSNEALLDSLNSLKAGVEEQLTSETKRTLKNWGPLRESYEQDEYITKIRDKEIRTALNTISLSGLKIPKVVLPKYKDYG